MGLAETGQGRKRHGHPHLPRAALLEETRLKVKALAFYSNTVLCAAVKSNSGWGWSGHLQKQPCFSIVR